MTAAILGLVCAIRLPSVPVTDTKRCVVMQTNLNPSSTAADFLVLVLGASYLTQLPLLANDIMNLAPQQVSYLLAAFAVGVGAGSKLVPLFGNIALRLGILMMIVAGFALPWVASMVCRRIDPFGYRGAGGRTAVVPLYVWMQQNWRRGAGSGDWSE